MSEFNKYSTDGGATFIDVEDSNAVHYGDQSKGYVGKNLVYKTLFGYNVYGNANGSEGFWIAAGTNGFVAIAKVKKNTNYTLTKDLGNRIRVVGFASEPVINGSHPADPTKYAQLAVGADELKTLSFNSGVFEYVACNLNSNTEYTGNMNAMVRLASIPDSTYEPYLTPNTDLMSYVDNAIVGVHNFLDSFATSSGNFTVNSDKSILVNGTFSERTVFFLRAKETNFVTKAGQYKLYLVGNTTKLKIVVDGYNGLNWYKSIGFTYTNTDITIDYNGYDRVVVYIVADTQDLPITLNNVTIYPMFMLPADTDTTYRPWAMTNRELTELLVPERITTTFFSNIPTGFTLSSSSNVVKIGNLIFGEIVLVGTFESGTQYELTIDSKYRPRDNYNTTGVYSTNEWSNISDGIIGYFFIGNSGGGIFKQTSGVSKTTFKGQFVYSIA